ncbi:MAG: 50S ribosomal protein L3 [Nannocystaceae bacterium]|nr:50S ribosomal protein L3 [Nannocystaceae bacterium]
MKLQPGMLAKKLGMTQIFLEDGTRVPVTVLSVRGNTVVAHRTMERDGYTALQIGFDEQKPHRMTKADLGRFKQANVAPRRFVREFRVDAEVLAKHPVGSELAPAFAEGQFVDVIGMTKGKGFQGGMRRHKLGGKPNTHGTHEYFRHGGSIGCRLTPGKVHPGKRMPGHLGAVRQTAQNLRVAKVLADQGVLLVRGPVPGAANEYVTVQFARKVSARQAHGST